MFHISISFAATLIGVVLVLAQPAQASPQDDQFLTEVLNNSKQPLQPNAYPALIGAGHSACSILAQGYNSTEAMNAMMHGLHDIVRDQIGFMLSATKAYCPQYTYMYAGA
jgi:hypothetical protein